MTNNKNRLVFMDFSAIISSFAVVTLHTSGDLVGVISKNNYMHPSVWLTVLINIIFAFGVPMFFMQSGANLLNYRQKYSTKIFTEKRIKKVVIPFILWSLIAFVCTEKLDALFLLRFVKHFLSASVIGPYWFFYDIIGFYLCVPFLSIIIRNADKRLLQYMLVLALVVNSILPLLLQVLKVNNGFNQAFPAISSYLQYFIAGYLVVHYDFEHKNQIYIVGICSLIIETLLTFFYSFSVAHNPFLEYNFGNLVKNFYDIQNIFAFLFVFALFLFLQQSEDKFKKSHLGGYIQRIAGCSYGIYLIHPILLAVFMPEVMNSLANTPIVLRILLLPVVVYLCSMALTYVVKKVPFIGKKIIP